MSYISHIKTALPENSYDLPTVKESIKTWLSNDPQSLKLCDKFLDSAKTKKRHFVLPPAELIKLGGIEQRSQLFEEFGIALGANALSQAIKESSIPLNGLIFTSCSFPSIPAIDTEIIQKVGLPLSTFRVPIFQYGCVGGVAGLSLASALSEKLNSVALLSVELCSLVFQPSNHEPAQLVGAAIFGDGSACAVINKDSGILKILKTSSHLLPHSAHIMGYDFKDNGWHLKLDKDLPNLLLTNVKPLIENFLKDENLAIEDINWWLFHPGSMKILKVLKQLLELNDQNAGFADRFLTEHGNLSSTSILYIIKDFIDSKQAKIGEKTVVMGIGPGLTVELVLLESE